MWEVVAATTNHGDSERAAAEIRKPAALVKMALAYADAHPPGEHPWHRNPFFIRVIREIRGSNCCFWDLRLAPFSGQMPGLTDAVAREKAQFKLL